MAVEARLTGSWIFTTSDDRKYYYEFFEQDSEDISGYGKRIDRQGWTVFVKGRLPINGNRFQWTEHGYHNPNSPAWASLSALVELDGIEMTEGQVVFASGRVDSFSGKRVL